MDESEKRRLISESVDRANVIVNDMYILNGIGIQGAIFKRTYEDAISNITDFANKLEDLIYLMFKCLKVDGQPVLGKTCQYDLYRTRLEVYSVFRQGVKKNSRLGLAIEEVIKQFEKLQDKLELEYNNYVKILGNSSVYDYPLFPEFPTMEPLLDEYKYYLAFGNEMDVVNPKKSDYEYI